MHSHIHDAVLLLGPCLLGFTLAFPWAVKADTRASAWLRAFGGSALGALALIVGFLWTNSESLAVSLAVSLMVLTLPLTVALLMASVVAALHPWLRRMTPRQR